MKPGWTLYLVPTLLAVVCAASGRSAAARRSPRDTVPMTVNVTHRIGPGSGKTVAGPGDLIVFHISALAPGPEVGTYQTVFKLTFPSSKDASFPANENPNWHFPVVNGVCAGTSTSDFASIDLTFVVNDAPPDASVTLTAEITYEPEFNTSTTVYSGTGVDQVGLAAPLSVSITSAPAVAVRTGKTVHFTVTATGSQPATALTLTASLSADPAPQQIAKALKIVTNSVSQPGTVSGTTVTWKFGALTPPFAPVEFDVKVAAGKATAKIKTLTCTANAVETPASGGSISAPTQQAQLRVVHALPPIVNSTGDSDAADPTDSPETATPGEVTLRSAVEFVNAQGAPDAISFRIKSGGDFPNTFDHGVPKIEIGSGFPVVTPAVGIDGSTQPGGLVWVDDATAGQDSPGQNSLALAAGGEVSGLVVSRFKNGIAMGGAGRVHHCRIGTDAEGLARAGNGIGILIQSDGVTVDHNLISGNNPAGVKVESGNHVLIEHNVLGLDSLGHALPNGKPGDFPGLPIEGTPDDLGVAGGAIWVGVGNASILHNRIGGNHGSGVLVNGKATIQDNRIGSGNQVGVTLDQGGSAVIGGTKASEGNTIDQNIAGIVFDHATSADTQVLGNDISENTTIGVLVHNSSHSTIGGSERGAGNVIAKNGGFPNGLVRASGGVAIEDGSDHVTVQGNRIDGNGQEPRQQLTAGVLIKDSDANTIGGPAPADGNEIASTLGGPGVLIQADDTTTDNQTANANLVEHNSIRHNRGGITVIIVHGGLGTDRAATGNAFLANSIFDNSAGGKLGIDLGDDGVTQNDSHAHLFGPNLWQNFPTINSVTVNNGDVVVTGALTSGAIGTPIQLFASSKPNPSGSGEGEVFVAEAEITQSAFGSGFQFTIPVHRLAGRPYLTVTATDATAGTSEFSQAWQIGVGPVTPAGG